MVAPNVRQDSPEALYRAALEVLGLKRLTPKVSSRLDQVMRLVRGGEGQKPAAAAHQSRSPIVPVAHAQKGPAPQPRQPATSHVARPAVLTVGAMRRITDEIAWIASRLTTVQDFASADRHAAQGHRREAESVRQRLTTRLEELQAIIKTNPIDPTYQPSSVSAGVVVKVHHSDGEVERVVITCQQNLADELVPVSPFTALGKALTGARVGETVTYSHDGHDVTVDVVAITD